MTKRIRAILSELEHHAPFTLVGAATGIICMLLFRKAGPEVNHKLFLVFHPAHVVLSAIVTAALFRLYDKKASVLKIVVIGYLGAIGVATVSDCVLPFFGESLLGVAIPTHADLHQHEHAHEDEAPAPACCDAEHAHEHETDPAHSHEVDASAPNEAAHVHDHETEAEHSHETPATAPDAGAAAHAHAHEHEYEAESQHSHGEQAHTAHGHGSVRERLHLGFIEDWYIVNPAALLGILIAYCWPRTKFPHAGHVLISTWASSFHVLMNTHRELSPVMLIGVFLVLFIAVWLPCCISDIVFPLLFVKSAPPHTHGHAHGEDQP